MLPKFWIEALKDGWKVSNCKIISHEGKETFTHKIVLAAKSEFLKDILVDIPEGHDVVIILPDFSSDEIELFMQKMMGQSNIVSSLWNIIVKAEESDTILSWRDCDKSKDDVINLNDEPVATEPKHDILKQQKHQTDALETNVIIMKDNNDKEFFYEELKTVEPTNEIVDKKQMKQIKQTLYEEAIADFLSGKSPSLRQCALKFGVPKSSLYEMIMSDRGYNSKGRKLKVLSVEEELNTR